MHLRRRLGALMIALAVTGCASSNAAATPARAKTDTSNRPTGAPLVEDEVTFVDPDGKGLALSALRGRPVVLVFNRGFAGYVCPYCVQYTAALAERTPALRALGAEVLVVYPTRDEDRAQIATFRRAVDELLAEEGTGELPFPVYLDLGLKATHRFGLDGELTRPSTFVLDAQGVVRFAYVGTDPDERPTMDRVEAEVRRVAAGS